MKQESIMDFLCEYHFRIIDIFVQANSRNWLIYKLTSSPVSLQTNQLAWNKLTR